MKRLSTQDGFSHIVVLVLILVVVAVGAVSWRVAQSGTNTDTTTATSDSKAVPATIKSKADVRKATQSLDSTAIDNSVNPSSLDADLNAVL